VDKLEQLKTKLAKGDHRVIALDLAQPEQVLQHVKSTINEIGQLDILINNGGVSQRSLFLENDFSVYRQLMEVNYFGLVA
ncbi:SDR family NAD(P)-dependent oxidoreductase, partial [Streptomyces scabiei]|uniref:SDR family NAD(P)-dependent oxidoreductase n=1 Tax=Streptomyces scabiei TaxID=1930 RepID=UPI0038F6451B